MPRNASPPQKQCASSRASGSAVLFRLPPRLGCAAAGACVAAGGAAVGTADGAAGPHAASRTAAPLRLSRRSALRREIMTPPPSSTSIETGASVRGLLDVASLETRDVDVQGTNVAAINVLGECDFFLFLVQDLDRQAQG